MEKLAHNWSKDFYHECVEFRDEQVSALQDQRCEKTAAAFENVCNQLWVNRPTNVQGTVTRQWAKQCTLAVSYGIYVECLNTRQKEHADRQKAVQTERTVKNGAKADMIEQASAALETEMVEQLRIGTVHATLGSHIKRAVDDAQLGQRNGNKKKHRRKFDVPCRDFARGHCPRGDSCSYKHTDNTGTSSMQEGHSEQVSSDVDMSPPATANARGQTNHRKVTLSGNGKRAVLTPRQDKSDRQQGGGHEHQQRKL
jgi:hypothetical protein